MAKEQNKGGRPPLTEEQKSEIVSKLEPYLKTGLSISKSLHEAKVSRATFYRLMSDDEWFRDKINQYRNFVSVLVNNTIIRELMTITEHQNGNELKGLKPQELSKEDRGFLMWFALNSNLCHEEWGRREKFALYDPEVEIQKVKQLLDQGTTREIQAYSP